MCNKLVYLVIITINMMVVITMMSVLLFLHNKCLGPKTVRVNREIGLCKCYRLTLLLLFTFMNTLTYHYQMKLMARLLIANQQCGALSALRVSPYQSAEHHTLGALVVHTAAALLLKQNDSLLYPLAVMITNPAQLSV